MHMYAHLYIVVYICAHSNIVYRHTQNMNLKRKKKVILSYS